MNKSNKQSGIALIIVLIVIAILTPLSVSLLLKYQDLSDKITIGEEYDESVIYAIFAEDFSRYALDVLDRNKNSDTASSVWSEPRENLPAGNRFIGGSIIELNGRLNLNNLYIFNENNEKQKQRAGIYKLALENLLKKAQVLNPKILTKAVIDWIDKDSDGLYDSNFYESLDKPYRAANAPMVHISELKMVAGFTPKIYQKIKGCLTALPIMDAKDYGTKINVNFANPVVLGVMVQAFKDYFIRQTSDKNVKKDVKNSLKVFENFANSNDQILDCKLSGSQEFETIDQFIGDKFKKLSSGKSTNGNQEPKGKAKDKLKKLFGVKSNYFIANIKIISDDSVVNLQTHLKRENTTKVLFRNFDNSIIPPKSSDNPTKHSK